MTTTVEQNAFTPTEGEGVVAAGATAPLYDKMTKVMAQMGWIEKTGYNSFHKYKYVEESAIVDKVRKAMVDAGLAMTMDVGEFSINGDVAIARVYFTIACTTTGAKMTGSIVAEGQDKGDKKFPKLYASATKYFLMKTFLIPSGDDPEGDISTDKQNYGAGAEKKGGNYKPSKKDLENQVNALVFQLTQKGYQGTYVYQICRTELGKEFEQLTDLSTAELQKLNTKLQTELNNIS